MQDEEEDYAKEYTQSHYDQGGEFSQEPHAVDVDFGQPIIDE